MNNVGLKKRTFDIHLASDVMSTRILEQLQELGFHKDAFIGGTTGVVHPQHYSLHPESIEDLRIRWQASLDVLSNAAPDEFQGYAEAEITPTRFRTTFAWKPFDPSVRVPLRRFEYEQCPLDDYKDVDIHLTAELLTIDPQLQSILENDINFHYVDIRRPTGAVVRVYTVQPLNVRRISALYHTLTEYIQAAGGMQGKIKLEATYAYARFPYNAQVCPIIRAVPLV